MTGCEGGAAKQPSNAARADSSEVKAMKPYMPPRGIDSDWLISWILPASMAEFRNS